MVPFSQSLLVEAFRRGWLTEPALGELGSLTAAAKRDRAEWVANNVEAFDALADVTSPHLWDWMEAAEYPASTLNRFKRTLFNHPDNKEEALRIIWNAADRMAGGDETRRNLALLDLMTRFDIRAQPGTVDFESEWEAEQMQRAMASPYTQAQTAQIADLLEAGLLTQAELDAWMEETFNEPTYADAKQAIGQWIDRALEAGNRERLPPWWPNADPRHRAPRNCAQNTIPIATFVVRAHCRRRPQAADLGEGPQRNEPTMAKKKKATAKKASPSKKATAKKASSSKKKATAKMASPSKKKATAKKASPSKKATAKKASPSKKKATAKKASKKRTGSTLGRVESAGERIDDSNGEQYGFLADLGKWILDAIAGRLWSSAKESAPILRLLDGKHDAGHAQQLDGLPALLGPALVALLVDRVLLGDTDGGDVSAIVKATRQSDLHERPSHADLRKRAEQSAAAAMREEHAGASRQAAAQAVGHVAALLELYPNSPEAKAIKSAPAPV